MANKGNPFYELVPGAVYTAAEQAEKGSSIYIDSGTETGGTAGQTITFSGNTAWSDDGSVNAFKLTDLAYNTYCWQVGAYDAAGNQSAGSGTKDVDVADFIFKPGVPANLSQTVTGNNVSFSWSAPTDDVGATGYHYRYGTSSELSGDGESITVTSHSLTGLADGTYYWQVRAYDANGNQSYWSEVKSFDISTAAPEITVSADVTQPTNQDVVLTASFNSKLEIVQKQYKFADGVWLDYTEPVEVSGNCTVYFTAADKNGNIGNAEYTVSNIDKIAPEVTITSDEGEEQAVLTAVFSDNVQLASQQYRFEDGSWKNYTGPVTVTENGTVYFKAEDTAGNETVREYFVNTIGEPGPVMGAAKVSKYNISLSWSKYTAEKGIKVTYELINKDDEIILVSSNKYTVKNAEIGTDEFRVRAVLSNGEKTLWSNEVAAEVKDVTAPKTGKITSVEQPEQESVLMKWEAATDNDGIKEYAVTCGSQTVTVGGSVTEYLFTGVKVAGNVSVSIQAFDNAGLEGKVVKKSFKMKDVTAPTAASNLSGSVDNKSGGTLTWTASTDNVGVTQYEVRIEGVSKNEGVSKVYKTKTNSVKISKLAAGEYKYTVTAYDKAKNASEVSEAGTFTSTDVIDPKIKKLTAKMSDGDVALDWSASDETGFGEQYYQFYFDGIKKTVGSDKLMELTSSELTVGKHIVKLMVWDAAGNGAEKICTVNIKEKDLVTIA